MLTCRFTTLPICIPHCSTRSGDDLCTRVPQVRLVSHSCADRRRPEVKAREVVYDVVAGFVSVWRNGSMRDRCQDRCRCLELTHA